MMNSGWRLDAKNAALANRLRRATPIQQQLAVRAACEAVVRVVALDTEADVDSAIRELREAGAHDPTLRNRLKTLSERFDDEYFRLTEDGAETTRPEALYQFARARAVSALVFALSGEPSQFHEAIYEAMSALVDDPSTVTTAVESILRETSLN